MYRIDRRGGHCPPQPLCYEDTYLDVCELSVLATGAGEGGNRGGDGGRIDEHVPPYRSAACTNAVDDLDRSSRGAGRIVASQARELRPGGNGTGDCSAGRYSRCSRNFAARPWLARGSQPPYHGSERRFCSPASLMSAIRSHTIRGIHVLQRLNRQGVMAHPVRLVGRHLRELSRRKR